MSIMRSLFVVTLTVVLIATLSACATVQEREREEKRNFRIADTNMRLGLGYLQQGRVQAALEKLQKALAAKPDYPEAHSTIALVYGQLAKNEKAEKHYLRALELSPKEGSVQNNYAVFLCGIGKPVDAEAYFLRAIKSRNYRTPAQALENLGVCSMQTPDQEKAEIYLRKALQIDPRLPRALLQMAQISVEKKRAMSGRAYLQRYQEVATLGADGLWLGIQVETQLGDMEAVRDYENRLYRHFPDSRELQLLLEKQMAVDIKTGSVRREGETAQ